LKTTYHDRSALLSPLSMLLCHQKPPDDSSVPPNNIDGGEGGWRKSLSAILSVFPYREIEKYAR